MNIIADLTTPVLLFIAYKSHQLKNKVAIFYIIAQGIFLTGATFYSLLAEGFIEYSIYSRHLVMVTSLIEIVLFSLVLGYKIKLLEDEKVSLLQKNLKKEKLLFEQSKLASMGEMIGNIAHQWRQPLNRLNLSLEVISTSLNEQNIDKNFLKTKIKTSQSNLEYMSNTIKDFTDFFHPDKQKTKFNLKDIINKTTNILGSRLKHVDLIVKIDSNLYVKTFENEFIQVLLIILNNSVDSLEQQTSPHPKITILSEIENNEVKITITDNGKGIQKEHLHKVFDPYFTTKFKSEGTGLGLYIAKMIIIESIKGDIEVFSDKNGTKFTITLQK
jgi:signal transduction histidine kinase